MPQAERSRRVERCAYTEDGRRCRRSASGPSGLCRPHQIAIAAQVERETRDGGAPSEGIYNLVDRILNGRKVREKDMKDAVSDARQWWAEYQRQQAQQQQANPGQPRQPRWWDPLVNIPGASQRQEPPRAEPPPPPRVDPALVQRARIVCGFTPREPLDADLLRRRRKDLARKHHPDRGGSPTKMQEINAAIDILEQSLVG